MQSTIDSIHFDSDCGQPTKRSSSDPLPHVHKLNDDCLISIFQDINYECSLSCFRELLSATHVCGRWRTLAVDHCPSLWTKYAFLSSRIRSPTRRVEGCGGVAPGNAPSLDFGVELVRRCRQLPLEVGWYEWAGQTFRTASDIISALAYSSRFRAYSLNLRSIGTEDGLRSAVFNALAHSSPAPNLRSLSLSIGHRNAPRTMFGGDLATISTLSLKSSSWIDFDTFNIGTGLEHLTVVSSVLHGREPQNGLPCTIGAWLDALKHVPNLRSLEIELVEFMCHGRPHTPETNLPRISLNHLTNLRLYFNRNQDLDLFFEHVSIPRCGKLQLESKAGSGAKYSSTIRKIITHYVVPPFRGGSTLSVLACNRCSAFTVRFTAMAGPGSPGPRPVPGLVLPPIDLTFCVRPPSLDFDPRYLDTIIREYVPFLNRIDFLEVSLRLQEGIDSEDDVIQDFIYHYTYSLQSFVQSSKSPKTLSASELLLKKIVPRLVVENGRLYTPLNPDLILEPRDIKHTCYAGPGVLPAS